MVAVHELGRMRGSPGPTRSWVAITVPMIATPNEPPTWRMLLITAEPTPAWSTGTELIAAAVVGAIVIAIPRPATSSPGRMFPIDDRTSSVAKIRSDAASNVIPPPISQRGPRRSAASPRSERPR